MKKDHSAHGRAKHPWLTGTASWFYTAATKYILGIRPTYKGLEIDPCVPSDLEEFENHKKMKRCCCNIKIKNPNKIEKGVKSIRHNNKSVDGIIPIQNSGSINEVVVIMC